MTKTMKDDDWPPFSMTPRDFLAAQALPFALAAGPSYYLSPGYFPNADPLDSAVRYAYIIADAMLKEAAREL